jgi:hypothetical protein
MTTKTTKTAGEGFGWDDKVEVPEDGHTLLPEGPAVFVISKLERRRKEFGSFGVINVAVMTFECSPLDGDQEASVTSQFGLAKSLGWKIVKLATACGFRRHGDSSEIDPRWWAKFEGASGKLVITHRKFDKKDGSKGTSNDIKDFLAPDDDQAAGEAKDLDNFQF